MNSDLIKKYRHRILEMARERRVSSVSVFGSVATGKEGPKSDIDLLVEPDIRCSLLDLISLKYDIEDLTGCSVDIVSSKGLSPHVADKILKEATPL